jgi:nucleotide-binding universal stress UspA family protein
MPTMPKKNQVNPSAFNGSAAKKIIWAIDPFTQESDIFKSAGWCVRALVKSERAQVLPVFVWTAPPAHPSQAPDPAAFQALQKEGQEKVDRVLSRIEIPGIQPFRVLANPSFTVREEARALVAFAKEQGAELIVVSSHGRKGVKRLFLGSFAETLTLVSDVPLMTVHPGWKRVPELKTILFPTDFSDESLQAFDRVLDFAAPRKSRILIFSKDSPTIYPTFDLAFSAYNYQEELFEEERAANQKAASVLVEKAKKRGLKAEAVFDRSRKGSVAKAVLARAKKEGALIALASQSGPVAAALLGSTTRQILREAEQPVWVIHPLPAGRAGAAKKGEPLFKATQGDIDHDLIEHGRPRTA